MKHVYEIVDSTNPEQYWTLGIYSTLGQALEILNDINNPNDLGGDHEDYEDSATIEIRERELDVCSGVGKTIITQNWEYLYNEDMDDYLWKRICSK